MEKTITIPGNPIAKKRPRFARRGKFVTTYNDQETEEGRVLWEIKQQWKDPPIEKGVGVMMDVTFYMPIPESMPKKQRDRDHVKKPDLDNLIKFLKDVCNGTVWHDDSQVWKISAEKKYDECPRTNVFLRL